MSIKNFLGSIIKKQIAIDLSAEDYYFEVIPEVKKWFMDLPIPVSLFTNHYSYENTCYRRHTWCLRGAA